MAEETVHPDLRAAWLSLTKRLDVEPKRAKKAFKSIRKCFEMPGRYYHTLAHIKAILGLIDTHESEIEDPDRLRFVTWFHDLIYDSTRTDNEEVSAAMAEETMAFMGLPTDLIQQVSDLILRTEGHQTEGATPDEQLFLDFDLAILGTPPETYQQYAQDVRAEYGWVSTSAYVGGRKQVLEGFLDRAEIYSTDLGKSNWDENARTNLAWELNHLDNQ